MHAPPLQKCPSPPLGIPKPPTVASALRRRKKNQKFTPKGMKSSQNYFLFFIKISSNCLLKLRLANNSREAAPQQELSVDDDPDPQYSLMDHKFVASTHGYVEITTFGKIFGCVILIAALGCLVEEKLKINLTPRKLCEFQAKLWQNYA